MAPKAENLTTKADFELFKKEADKWVDFFQLRSWRVSYVHEEPSKKVEGSAGWCSTVLTDRVCNIGLAVDWEDSEITKERIRELAFHEVCELLLSRLRSEARVDVCTTQENDISEQTHAIIRRLEHAVFK